MSRNDARAVHPYRELAEVGSQRASDELDVIRDVLGMLARLDPEARKRIANYVVNRIDAETSELAE